MISLADWRSRARNRATDRRGFTLVELMITLTVLAVVMIVMITVMQATYRSKSATSNRKLSIRRAFTCRGSSAATGMKNGSNGAP